MDENKVIIYTTSDGQTKIDVRLEDETLWLTHTQMCELYQTSIANVVEHIKYIYGGRKQPVGISDRFEKRVAEDLIYRVLRQERLQRFCF